MLRQEVHDVVVVAHELQGEVQGWQIFDIPT